MTHLISAYPCLGKSTIYSLNKNKMFDREFNESRSRLGMDPDQIKTLNKYFANILQLQLDSNYHDYVFMTDDLNIIKQMDISYLTKQSTFILPNYNDPIYMKQYKESIITRSGNEWYTRVMVPKLKTLPQTIEYLTSHNLDIRFTTVDRPYIEDVINFNKNIILPNEKEK